MDKILIILSFVILASCGVSQEEKRNIAAVTCSIMSETRNMDAAVRVREMNDAREKIGGEPFLRGDDAIQEAFEYGLCQELVLDDSYKEILQPLKDAKRLAREKRAEEAEERRIADSKPTVKEEFYSNGKLKSRINYQSKSVGGEKHGLSEDYYENGQLAMRGSYKDGIWIGSWEIYYETGQLNQKFSVNDEEIILNYEEYNEDGTLKEKRL